MDPRRLLPVLAFVAAISVVGCAAALLVARDRPAGSAASASGESSSSAGDVLARRVLAQWDARRSDAWASGDVAALRRLYAPGSPAGRADVRMLRSYVARGLRVEGLTTQVLGLTVSSTSDSRLSLVVTDRVVGGVAVPRRAREGKEGVPLPVDRASTRAVELVRVDRAWVVRTVRESALP